MTSFRRRRRFPTSAHIAQTFPPRSSTTPENDGAVSGPQRVALTGLAAVDEPVPGLDEPATDPELIWKTARLPPPPGFLGDPADEFLLMTTTLPKPFVADESAALVAAVERSSATAAKA